MKLKIAAKVDHADQAYFEKQIEPLLDDPLVEFVGEIGDADKPDFLGDARALLFPIDWPEPFGLVMIEAMAAGTPVDRLAQRLDPGSDRARPHRLPGREHRRGGRGGRASAALPRAGGPRRVRASASPSSGWRATIFASMRR